MKSRPIWGVLTLDKQARTHLICAEREGLEAVADLFGGRSAPASATILYGDDGSTVAMRGAFLGDACTFLVHPSRETLLTALEAHLDRASMSTALYLSGSEAFLNAASAIASAYGVIGGGLQTELRGEAARRVQCVHCKGMMDEIGQSPIVCSHCGLNLMVRDHYSRRLGAFMAVCVDAEEPGVLPETTRF